MLCDVQVQSSQWFDLSPYVDVTQVVSSQGQQLWVQRYADLMTATAQAVAATGQTASTLIYASLDRYWSVPPVISQWESSRANIGGENVLLGLYSIIGGTFPWHLCLHPYGPTNETNFALTPGAGPDQVATYSWATLPDVAAFADQHYPGQLLIAPEEGLQSTQYDDTDRALYVCQSFNYALLTPRLLWLALNNLQDSGMDPYGLIPTSSGPLLDGASPILLAYQATAKKSWGQTAGHWCCVNAALGCPP